MSDFLIRAAAVFAFWALGLFIANPFLENRRMRLAALGCGVAASVCFVLQALVA